MPIEALDIHGACSDIIVHHGTLSSSNTLAIRRHLYTRYVLQCLCDLVHLGVSACRVGDEVRGVVAQQACGGGYTGNWGHAEENRTFVVMAAIRLNAAIVAMDTSA